MLFLFSKAGNAAVLEEKYAKEIALAIDAAEPAMTIHLNMEDAIEEAENLNLNQIVTIENNIINVKLREKGGYSYSFFNDVKVNVNFDGENKEYYFVIEKND